MGKTDHIHLGQALEAATDWWREAGVDCEFVDEPHNWLAAPEPAPAEQARPAAAEPAPVARPKEPPFGGERSGWPLALAGFADWWLAEPSLEIAGSGPRIAPRGSAGADLMVLVAMPEAEDAQELLSGPQGKLVAAMLDAMGIAPDKAYIAAALPGHTRHPDWAALADREYGAIVRHHVVLANPKRLLVLGREILTLFKHDTTQGAAHTQQIALEGIGPAVLASVSPEALLGQQRFRAALWQAWLDWRE